MNSIQSAPSTLDVLKKVLRNLSHYEGLPDMSRRKGEALFMTGQCQLLTTGKDNFECTAEDEFDDFQVNFRVEEEQLEHRCSCETTDWCAHQVGSLMHVVDWLNRTERSDSQPGGKAYTREGMIRRVLRERQDKANRATEYKIQFASNQYGEHVLTNERQVKYKLTFRDFESKTGYCSCPDYRTNKLGTCKHLMYAFEAFDKSNRQFKKGQAFPFVEIFLDPLNDYQVSWFFPGQLKPEIETLIQKYFGQASFLPDQKIPEFLGFLEEATQHKQLLLRPEVPLKVEKAFDERMLKLLKDTHELDYSGIRADLYPYQKEGVEFATFREGAIIADEMGLGKTLQAIATAKMKKELFGFKRTIVICPASLKGQWKMEIEKFSDLEAVIVEGNAKERQAVYRDSTAFFLIVNYEKAIRDLMAINRNAPDFVILDEAQRIKNYRTQTAAAIKAIQRKHALILTGTPLENRLIDLFSIVEFLDPFLLTPLWEFSQQHCYFDQDKPNKITGYYDLSGLKDRISHLLLRRVKREVIRQLPQVTHIDIPVTLHPEQTNLHAGYMRSLSAILGQRYLTPFDLQQIMNLLTKMRMVCDSTFLVDPESNISPKLDILKILLTEDIDLESNERKIIIFSEWVKMNQQIGKLLSDLGIGYVELNGRVPVKNRQKLIEEFNNNPKCRIFLSTEAGGSGLNLQAADTVINFELPWNPAKKNQRIGRIDRLGQRAEKLTVVNLVSRNSIEMSIAAGLLLKQELFDGVLTDGNQIDMVDFSAEGRSQFLRQLESAMEQLIGDLPEEEEEVAASPDEVMLDLAVEPAETHGDMVPEEKAAQPAKGVTEPKEAAATPAQNAEEIEKVMEQGLGFLAGIFKMATGKDISPEKQTISVDRETGEVTMKFRLPGF